LSTLFFEMLLGGPSSGDEGSSAAAVVASSTSSSLDDGSLTLELEAKILCRRTLPLHILGFKFLWVVERRVVGLARRECKFGFVAIIIG
jgi:hypothetical protein